jgi:hypothetical protein
MTKAQREGVKQTALKLYRDRHIPRDGGMGNEDRRVYP